MKRISPDIKRLAAERKHASILVRIDGSTLDPDGGDIEYEGPVSRGQADELWALLERWLKEKRA